MDGPRILDSTPPHGFTQYTDEDGDYLTFAEVMDPMERGAFGFVAVIATPNPYGIGLTAHQAQDLARRLLMAADPGLTPTMRGIHCTAVSASGQSCIFGLGHAVDYHLDQQGARWSEQTTQGQPVSDMPVWHATELSVEDACPDCGGHPELCDCDGSDPLDDDD